MSERMKKKIFILAIESSCDETSAAVLYDKRVLSNVIADQKVHGKYGGVVPELASRAHQANIVPVVAEALSIAGITLNDLSAIAFTQGPGLMGSLLVGTSFAKSVSLAMNIPLIAVNHMEGHVLAHLIENNDRSFPSFPFLCLTVSGGHTQIVRVDDAYTMNILGETRDDAAGEAFDKAAKLLGLPYPGGPQIDRLAKLGDSIRFRFSVPHLDGIAYSFSGLKTSLLYFLKEQLMSDRDFIEKNKADICASYQHTIVTYLLKIFEKAARESGITDLALAGGVSANSSLRMGLKELCDRNGWHPFIPDFEYCTDNAAMIGIAAWYKFQESKFADLSFTPKARMGMG
ncbi:MAG: tRNA (adenosine(37)-N6)-threonylcarbamoyltransferase complex transferase subunit TsaD [Crocinitomicaceae bacterium]|nr:tRNA (adenosine(37)-N6)-threonylcarbamoyltransferase complex transferase subunit TsaD [Crocinitomicaceae bacterium]